MLPHDNPHWHTSARSPIENAESAASFHANREVMQHNDSIAFDTRGVGKFEGSGTGGTAKLEGPDKGLTGIQTRAEGGSIATYDPTKRVDRLLSTETSIDSGFTKTEKKFQDGNPDGLKSEVSIKNSSGHEQITAYLQNGERIETDKQDGKILSTKRFDAQGSQITSSSSKPESPKVKGGGSNVPADAPDVQRDRSAAVPADVHLDHKVSHVRSDSHHARHGGLHSDAHHGGGHGGTHGAQNIHGDGVRRHSRHLNRASDRVENTPDGGEHHGMPASLKGNSNAERIYNFLREKGLTPAQAAGVLGNLKQENAEFDPSKPGDGGHSLGIAQWNDGKDSKRKTALFQFAKKEHADPRDLNTQLNFLWHELQTTESKAYEALVKTNTPEKAAQVFSSLYERAGDPNNKARTRNARMAFNEFGARGTLLASN